MPHVQSVWCILDLVYQIFPLIGLISLSFSGKYVSHTSYKCHYQVMFTPNLYSQS